MRAYIHDDFGSEWYTNTELAAPKIRASIIGAKIL